jgi:hypothetical protein
MPAAVAAFAVILMAVTLVRRCKTPTGWRRYPAATASKGRVLANTVIVDGKNRIYPEHARQEGIEIVEAEPGEVTLETYLKCLTLLPSHWRRRQCD